VWHMFEKSDDGGSPISFTSTGLQTLGRKSLSDEAIAKLEEKYLLAVEQSVLNAWYQESECFDTGWCYPPDGIAMTMVGRRRLANIRTLLNDAIDNNVPGDFVEAGTWKGGSCIMAAAVLVARGVEDRNIWVCDSFKGIPAPDIKKYPDDNNELSINSPKSEILNNNSVQRVQDSFRKFGLLSDQVKFLEGYFRDTLPTAPISRIAVLRLDGDLYQSTWETLEALYKKVSINGSIIVDDYDTWPQCQKAVDDYRRQHDITDPILNVPHEPTDTHRLGVYWKKTAEGCGMEC